VTDDVRSRGPAAWSSVLPVGGRLPAPVFRSRHRWLVGIGYAHLPALLLVGTAWGVGTSHLLAELTGILGLLVVASVPRLDHRLRAAAVTTALTGCSTVLVHLTGGLTESHFHFFIVVALITVYQQWTPFLIAIGWVVVHHAVLGSLAPASTFGSPEATASPLLWSLIHGVAILAASAANLLTWRLAEVERQRAEDVLASVPQPTYGIGPDGVITFSNRALTELVGLDPIGRHHHDLLHGERAPCHLCASVQDAQEHRSEDVLWPHADGTSVPVELRSRPAESGVVITFWDIGDQLAHRRELEALALTDALTGLANRTLLGDRLQQALEAPTGGTTDVAVLFLDLDRFKDLNDTLGHAAGDSIIRAISERIRSQTREEETIARTGGDEFVVLLPGADVDVGVAVAQRVLAAISRPLTIEGGEVFLSCSVGVAATSDPGTAPDRLLADADLAMYAAKAAGGGQVQAYRVDLRDRAGERAALGGDLHRAFDACELEVQYQPTWELDDLRISGAEALVRWRHPTRGVLSPRVFIEVAEQTGAIVPMGRWVLEQVCQQLETWRHDPSIPADELVLAVNLSVRQLRDPAVVPHLRELLAHATFEPRQLTLEVTETGLVEEGDAAIAVLEELRALGVSLAIDDFGTGFSSLSTLRRLPVDILKIDRSFITGIGADPGNQQVVRAIVGLARGLGLDVVAEGVEEPSDLAAVRALSCDRAQGYLLAHPSPAEQVAELLRGRSPLRLPEPGPVIAKVG
jgi:diguanylate cyclase (GGDEF)-like protein